MLRSTFIAAAILAGISGAAFAQAEQDSLSSPVLRANVTVSSDIVRIITLVDTYATLLEPDAETPAMTPEQAFGIMELMSGKLDSALRQAFRPVALGL